MSAKNRILSILRFLLLLAVCILATIILVFPLWKFSTGAPKVYTYTVLILAACLIVYLIIRKILSKRRKNK